MRILTVILRSILIAVPTGILSFAIPPLHAEAFVYAANCCLSGASISVIDQVSGTQAPGIPIVGAGAAITITPDGTTIFTAVQNPDSVVEIDGSSQATIAKIPLAGPPVAMAVSPDGSTLYIARCADAGPKGCEQGAVDAVSVATFTVIGMVPVPQGTPQGISLNPSGSYAYVSTGNRHPNGNPGIAVIAIPQNTISGFLPSAPAQLRNIVVLPTGGTAFVADLQLPLVYRVDLVSGQLLASIHVKSVPTGMSLSPDGSMLYVTDNNLTAISTLTNKVSFSSYITPVTTGITVSPDGTRCYISDWYESTLDTFDLTSQIVTARVPTGFRPMASVVTPDGTTSFVVNSGSSTVSQIGASVKPFVVEAEAGSEPIDLKLSPDGKFLYALNAYSSNVSIMSTSPFQRIVNIPTGYLPEAIAISPDGRRLYVSTYEASITVIDTAAREVIGNIPTSPFGSTLAYGMAVSSDGKKLFALTSYRDFSGILVIDTGSMAVVRSIPVAGEMAQIALGPQNDIAYISGDTNQPFLLVVDLAQGIQVAPIFTYKPFGVKVAPRGAYIYTGTTDRSSIVVIDRKSGTVVSSTPVAGTVAIAVDSAGDRVYATGPVVTVFDTKTRSVIGVVKTGSPTVGVVAQ